MFRATFLCVLPLLFFYEPDRLVTFTFSFSFSQVPSTRGWFTFYREHLTCVVPPNGPHRRRRREILSSLGLSLTRPSKPAVKSLREQWITAGSFPLASYRRALKAADISVVKRHSGPFCPAFPVLFVTNRRLCCFLVTKNTRSHRDSPMKLWIVVELFRFSLKVDSRETGEFGRRYLSVVLFIVIIHCYYFTIKIVACITLFFFFSKIRCTFYVTSR